MCNLNETDDFRAATRAWLETNCPAEMRSPMKSDGDICWRTQLEIQLGRSTIVATAYGTSRLDRSDLA